MYFTTCTDQFKIDIKNNKPLLFSLIEQDENVTGRYKKNERDREK